ncbi:tetratricopeptide repeat protein [Sphingosinicella sp. LHD-64]|uniref:tetratricopeptide repeat protein n=1 Tax=Sphingosinicella sp. LHD-64 TaxID=3072139 RepID=UPI00280D2E31|nr:tetratricopeptide repeat protein [Sphingosinicella sp. LHD-64]MDQ8755366.1 tetratricopeptide repeat protein [Sphingosinicella sp. LHD-64]
MTARKLLAAALLAVISVPAAASVQVIGSSSARLCYEAADSALTPSADDLGRCNTALRDEALSRADMVATHVNRGILFMRRGLTERAIADFDMAIAMDPAQAEAYLNKGAALMRQENAGDALPLFTASLERNTMRPELAHYGRAMANETLGNVREAYNDYRRAAELSPEWQEPRVELQRFRVVRR